MGIALIVVIGVLNFHPPHFLLESGGAGTVGARVLEVGLLADVVAAVVAAVGVYLSARWGWLLGMVIASIGAGLYVLQETVGLPGLPRMWWEPSRLVTLAAEVTFVILACRRLGIARGRTAE